MHGKSHSLTSCLFIQWCFNGAVHRSARKGNVSDEMGERMGAASTEPCTGVHGKCLDASTGAAVWKRFNGAVHRSARKGTLLIRRRRANDFASTEPCTGVHGKQNARAPASGSGPQLQRSRAPECTESSNHGQRRGIESALLQRSRAPECTESLKRLRWRLSKTRASTEPCTGVHGKFCYGRNNLSRTSHASTEPCTGVHGKGTLFTGVLAPSSASTEPCTGVHGKWLHDTTLRLSLQPSFNGAVHRSARKAQATVPKALPSMVLQRSRAPECTESRS